MVSELWVWIKPRSAEFWAHIDPGRAYSGNCARIPGNCARVSSYNMTTISIRPKDRLEGASNFSTWKARVMNLLEEHELDRFVTNEVEMPTTNVGRSAFRRNQAKAKRIIFDSVKDSILTVLIPLKAPKECFDTLVKLYESKIPSQKRTLKT